MKSWIKPNLFLILSLFISHTTLAAYPLTTVFELAPPPSPGSPADHDDYAELHRWQQVRSQAECSTANSQSWMEIDSFFGPETGILTESQMSAVNDLLNEVKETVEAEAKPLKEQYARERPYVADHTILPCISKPQGATSYPSSHAAMGIVLGKVLADLLPGDRAEIEAQAIQIGTNRVLGGVHHPSDVKAGQELGEEIYTALQSNPKFSADFNKAKRVLR